MMNHILKRPQHNLRNPNRYYSCLARRTHQATLSIFLQSFRKKSTPPNHKFRLVSTSASQRSPRPLQCRFKKKTHSAFHFKLIKYHSRTSKCLSKIRSSSIMRAQKQLNLRIHHLIRLMMTRRLSPKTTLRSMKAIIFSMKRGKSTLGRRITPRTSKKPSHNLKR